jgi:flagellar hook-length control protein FliK
VALAAAATLLATPSLLVVAAPPTEDAAAPATGKAAPKPAKDKLVTPVKDARKAAADGPAQMPPPAATTVAVVAEPAAPLGLPVAAVPASPHTVSRLQPDSTGVPTAEIEAPPAAVAAAVTAVGVAPSAAVQVAPLPVVAALAPAAAGTVVAKAPIATVCDVSLMPSAIMAPAANATMRTAAPEASAAAKPPAAQLAPVLVQLAHSAAGTQMTLRLDPLELGHVQVQISRAADGTATVQVTAERPETLRLLIADQPQLHRTLSEAGFAQDGRSLTFSLATPDSGAGGGGTGGNGGFAGSQSGHGQHRPGAPFNDHPAYRAAADTAATPWLRAGVDITA